MLLIGAGWLLLAAFDLWLLLIRPDVPRDTRLAFVLGLLGIYTFAFGFLAQTGLLKRFPTLGRDLTSPNPTMFLAGNFTALGLLFSAASLALRADREPGTFERPGGALLWWLQFPVVVIGALLMAAFTIVYLIVIAPIAWLAYTIVSAPLDSILTSARDIEIAEVDQATGDATSVSIKKLVDENLVTLRNVLVAIPALVSSLILDTPNMI